jgi:predicted dienelactone hydrolase
MRKRTAIRFIALLFCCGSAMAAAQDQEAAAVRQESLPLFDQARDRPVPVVVYTSASQTARLPKLAILSDGYGSKNTDYSFVANHLATRGYYVASIQHELPSDEPLPKTGRPYETRMPSWQRGVQNILFVLRELKKMRPELDYTKVVLIGHSHGGDTSMLFAQEHPSMVHVVISLDNRRMPFARTRQPRIFSIRSSDQVADEGVIPSPDEQANLGMRVVNLPATKHDDMWDGATDEQKAEITRHISSFLQDAE